MLPMIMLTMGLAHAQDAPTVDAQAATSQDSALTGDVKQGGGSSGSGTKKKSDGGGNKAATSKRAWDMEPYLRPLAGGSLYSSGGTTTSAIYIGAEVGLKYWQTQKVFPKYTGKTRLSGAYTLTSSDASGIDVRLGSFIGPKWKNASIQAGPDVFWNQYTWGDVELEPTLGVGVPVIGRYNLEVFSVYGGVEPAWLTNESRRVDWETTDSALPGFGHEFTYMAGAGFTFQGFAVGAGYTYKITSGGVQQGLGVSFNASGLLSG